MIKNKKTWVFGIGFVLSVAGIIIVSSKNIGSIKTIGVTMTVAGGILMTGCLITAIINSCLGNLDLSSFDTKNTNILEKNENVTIVNQTSVDCGVFNQ